MKEHFKGITDPRQAAKTNYNLLEIIVMTVCAVVSGFEYWEDIVDFCKVKEEWFRERLGLELKNGIASHDTFQRIFQLINPLEFEMGFMSWVRSSAKLSNGEIVSIDGKTVCGSKDTKSKAIHMVSAWANSNQLVLGQTKVNEKSNEITAIPTLLEMLELKGCIVTIDAMGCQKEIAKQVSEKAADYVFGLKGNQGTLNEDVRLYFETAKESPTLYPTITTHKTTNQGHGRIETRYYKLECNIDWLEQKPEWANLNGIGTVRSVVEKNGRTTEETRYFITSLCDVKQFAHAVRSHWGIESMHWCLDVVFHEDACRTRKDNSAENFAVIRHMAINILKQHPAKMSLARKRRKCGYDIEFMRDVLIALVS